MVEPAVRTTGGAVPSSGIDFGDVQGIVRFAHAHLTDATFLLLQIVEPAAARSWLQAAPVTTALATGSPPDTALQVALTRPGLEALGVRADTIAQFSDEFIGGMAGAPSRSRRLGDLDANAPARWEWGGSPATTPHLAVMLYARPGRLAAWEEAIQGEHWSAAFRILARLPTFTRDNTEPFGFVDGISQPTLDWERELAVDRKDQLEFGNLLALGEVVLGYPNEYGLYTDRPLLNPNGDPIATTLPPAEDVSGRRDLGRNGSYLVLRQLRQDVRGFWQFLDRQAHGEPARATALAEAMVGRTLSGAPIVPLAKDAIAGIGRKPTEIAANQFTYAADPEGVRCPFGAHIRRANPRTADLPGGPQGLVTRLLRMLGFLRSGVRDDLVASARFHRLLRRGRKYGTPLTPEDARRPGPADEARGLYFVCLAANIARQFEFVQNAWMMSPKFNGFADEADPLLGNRAPLPGCPRTDRFTIPQASGVPYRIAALPPFVTVRGGAYFFLPGIRALRYIAGATDRPTIVVPPDPPPAGSKLLLAVHRAGVVLLHIERRLEPFFRRAFDRALREPIASLTQFLIDWRRPNEGLKLAEERIAPDEEASLDSIIASFAGYMQRTYQPGNYQRGGNTKTHGIVRAQVTIREDLPAHLRHGVFATPRTFQAYVRFSGPGPNMPRDIEDAGFMSMAVKLMGVPGPKLMADEQFTQDLITVCTPTFVTPNTRENAKLQIWSFRDQPVFYFLNPMDSHLRDFVMQTLWTETQYNPLGCRYWSCVPYLLGEGQAMIYSFYPKSEVITKIPGVPFGRVPPNYLRDNMVATLARQDVEFDLLVQVQTDPHRMPIENAAVRWPEKLSPFIAAATVHIPKQRFDTPAYVEFAKHLSMNPWHCLPEHRPLGNQSRARRRMYIELSKLRQDRNQTPHIEPTGNEVLD